MWAIILMIGPLLFGFWAQMRVQSAFKKNAKLRTTTGLTGRQVAERILQAAGIHDVTVQSVPGQLTDHYNPSNKTLNLSEWVYGQQSVAAAGVAAHEVGHAIQHAKGYAPLKLRSALVPITGIASSVFNYVILGAIFLMFMGSGMGQGMLFTAVICLAVLALFQFITLPVEFDASKRAKVILEQMGLVQSGGEARGVSQVLDAAALTYVAALVATLGNLAYYLMILLANRE